MERSEVVNFSVFALKGQSVVAQGNALGMKVTAIRSPERAI